jgi:hypothetical protein
LKVKYLFRKGGELCGVGAAGSGEKGGNGPKNVILGFLEFYNFGSHNEQLIVY